jgi:phospholipid/cholesterol/gamma-HCH transport system substrate-binding protein
VAAVEQREERRGNAMRVAAIAAVIAAVAIVAWMLFGGGGGYRVSATFENAGQLVAGNDVRIGGVPVGSVESLELADDGRARVEFSVDPAHSPLQDGTRAVIRQASLSGIANRYIDLQLPNGAGEVEIADGDELPADETTGAVEIDTLFNTLDPRTRRSLQRFFQGSAAMFAGRADEAREGYRYLGPSLSRSRAVLNELAADTALLDRFVVDSARLVTALAGRREDLAALIGNLNETTRAAGADRAALSESLERLPTFMRRANTTFVNLRGALEDVDPLVQASEPAARRLRTFLPELRTFVTGAGPTVRDLSRTVRDPGRDDDVIDLLRTFPPLADIAVETAERNGAERAGAFPETVRALEGATPQIAFGRPFTPDLLGWFDDFSHTGGYDAIGGFSRSQGYFNFFSADVPPGTAPTPLSPQEQVAEFSRVTRTNQLKRCPGHAEVPAPDGSNVYSAEQHEQFDCNPAHRASGPVGE